MARNKDRDRVDQPADVTLEASAWSDPRFDYLAELVGVDVFSAIGRCQRIWAACTDRQSTSMTAADVDLFARRPGFADAMIKARLAASDEGSDTLHIHGTSDRIKWLAKLREQASAGGRKTAERRRERQATAAADGAPYGAPNAAPLGAPYALPQDQDQDQDLGSEKHIVVEASGSTMPLPGISTSKPEKKPKPLPHRDHAAFLDQYFQLYVARSDCKPTLGSLEGKIAKELLAAHGLDVCLARLSEAFSSNPWWASADQPVPLTAIRKHWDSIPLPKRREPTTFIERAQAAHDREQAALAARYDREEAERAKAGGEAGQ